MSSGSSAISVRAFTGPPPGTKAAGGFDGSRRRSQGGKACNCRIKTCRVPARSGQVSAKAKRDVQLVFRNVSGHIYVILGDLTPWQLQAISLSDKIKDSMMNVEHDGPGAAAMRLTALGGILGAIAASSCCIAPLVLFSLGISGAWIGNLTALVPYQPYFIAATLACLSYGYWLVYRREKMVCAEGAACARPLPNQVVKVGLVVATILIAGAIAFDLFAPLLLSS